MDMGLDGLRALVLGASKGLGLAIASGFAAEGAVVALASRTPEGSAAAAAGIRAATHGASVRPYVCDTGDLSAIEALARDVIQDFGGVDVLVLNSGGPPPGSAQGVSPEQWRLSFEAMFVGLVRLTDLLLPGMIARGFGRILSVISSGVIEPIPNLAISNAIRPALVGWQKTLAAEVAKHGVTVNAIAPGRIQTERLEQLDGANAAREGKLLDDIRALARSRIPVGRYGDPDEFAAAAVFLASDRASFVTGSILRVDGGQIASW